MCAAVLHVNIKYIKPPNAFQRWFCKNSNKQEMTIVLTYLYCPKLKKNIIYCGLKKKKDTFGDARYRDAKEETKSASNTSWSDQEGFLYMHRVAIFLSTSSPLYHRVCDSDSAAKLRGTFQDLWGAAAQKGS